MQTPAPLSESEAIAAFLDAMASNGVEIDEALIPDGHLHRAHVVGDRKHDRSAWYVLHTDGFPAGMFGSWRHLGAAKIRWQANVGAAKLSADERDRLRRENRERAKRNKAERDEIATAAARMAQATWDEAGEPDPDHPYLKRKQIPALGLRMGKWEKISRETGEVRTIHAKALLVPMRNASREIVSLQAIFPDKRNKLKRDKDFFTDGRTEGAFFTIGKPDPAALLFVFCEGYATGASIHLATGYCVVVCFSHGNLNRVVSVFRKRYPDARLLLAADNDQWTDAPVHNPGVHSARAAAITHKGWLAVPEFASLADQPNDFNDLHVREGLDEVRAQIEAALSGPVEAPGPRAMPFPAADTEAPPAAADEARSASALVTKKAVRDEDDGSFRILGYDHEKVFIFQREKQQVLVWTTSNFTENGLLSLAPLSWWEENFPAAESGFSKKQAINWMMRKAAERGIYDPNRMRGRGAWYDEGRTVIHMGNKLIVDGADTAVTEIKSQYVYELAKALPALGNETITADEAKRLLDVALSFRWTRPGSAALALGFIALAPVCGALQWRPHIWLTGGAGSGKTTILNEFIHLLLNGWDIYAQGNSSEAGIRQRLKSDALPVLFDETEQNDEREANRVQSVIALIRQSSTESEALTLKGTTSGEATHYHIRSMFCLSSIQVGLKHQADVDRICVLNLRSNKDRSEEDQQAADEWQNLSGELAALRADPTLPARIVRRAVNLLPITRQNIKVFTTAAARRFGTQREGDQYGTLLAGLWSLLSDDVATPEAAHAVIDRFDWSEHTERNDVDDAALALSALMESQIRLEGGVTLTVAELVSAAAGREDGNSTGLTDKAADLVLQRCGIKVDGSDLLFSNTSGNLRALVKGSKYEADLRGQLLRVTGAKRVNKSVRFVAHVSKCVSIPVDAAIGPAGGPQEIIPF